MSFTLGPQFPHEDRMLLSAFGCPLVWCRYGMALGMLRPRQQFEVFQAVVCPISVAVVNVLMRFKQAAQMGLHYQAVLKNISVLGSRMPVGAHKNVAIFEEAAGSTPQTWRWAMAPNIVGVPISPFGQQGERIAATTFTERWDNLFTELVPADVLGLVIAIAGRLWNRLPAAATAQLLRRLMPSQDIGRPVSEQVFLWYIFAATTRALHRRIIAYCRIISNISLGLVVDDSASLAA